MKPKRAKQRFRFVAPDRAVVGRWRATLVTALIDAAKHLRGWGDIGAAQGVRITVSCDAGVALAMLPEMKAKGYTVEVVG